ncbi:MAG: phosphotransferase [Muribaculaceae bacterium]|nr:phosphotransferase [Muribaculaceae bacterium]
MEDIKILSDLFKKKYGFLPAGVSRLPGAGSGRKYYRFSGGKEVCIGVAGENLRDCRAFVKLSNVFRGAGIPVPEVYEVSRDEMHYIQEDLGDTSLFSIIQSDSASCSANDDANDSPDDATAALVSSSMKLLAAMQCTDKKRWESCVEYSPFSIRQVFWDLNYFKYEFLKPSGTDFDEEALENDFESLAERIISSCGEASGFMFRDFQSRNVMVKNGECYFIDFQGGRLGPSLYDAVSFLWQAKAGFSDDFRYRMLEIYAREYEKVKNIPAESIVRDAPLFALFRTLQVLGAYGLRGLVEKKAHFLESIPKALQNLSGLIKNGALDSYPELKRVSERLIADERFIIKSKKEYLTIKVFSFSYKKGYPADYSGNGGGFMFDCRGMHNPGRYQEYKTLTGLDQPVIDFLKEKGETDLFSDRAYELVSPTVERYVKRGFNSLQIGFGCTGGQHRSVYCAEAVAKMLADRFPMAVVEVCHREQGIEKVYNLIEGR